MNKTKLNQSNDSNLDLSAADELLALKLKIKDFCIEFDGTSWGWDGDCGTEYLVDDLKETVQDKYGDWTITNKTMSDDKKEIEELKEKLLVQFERLVYQQNKIEELTKAGEAIISTVEVSKHCDWMKDDNITKAFDEWDYLQEYFEGMAKYINRNFQAST